MRRAPITDRDVERAQRAFTSALSAARPGEEIEVTLHAGNSTHRITNKLILSLPTGTGGTYSTQVWSDGMAGHTKREAYNALRLMTATLSLLPD